MPGSNVSIHKYHAWLALALVLHAVVTIVVLVGYNFEVKIYRCLSYRLSLSAFHT